MADRVFAEGARYENAGRITSALASYRLVKLLVPDYPGVDGKLAATGKSVEESARYNVVVSFTEAADINARILNGLKSVLGDKSGIKALTRQDVDAIKQMNPAFNPDGALAVTIGPATVTVSTPKVQTRTVRYVQETRLVENEEYILLRDEVDRDSMRVLELRRAVENTRREVRRIERERDMAEEQWRAASAGDPNKEELHRRYLRLRDEAEHAQERLNIVVRSYNEWVYHLRDEQQRLEQTPRFVIVYIYADYTYDITTNRITVKMGSRFSLTDGLAGVELLSDKVDAEQSVEDQVVQGFAPAGIEADPDELPPDDVMLARAEDELTADLRAALAKDLRAFPMRYLRMAEIAEQAGDKEAALDWYARYVLVCQELRLTGPMPRLTEADSIVRKATGYSPLSNSYDLWALKAKETTTP
jgi:predicted DNA-binding ArsR family transcriptional regulator